MPPVRNLITILQLMNLIKVELRHFSAIPIYSSVIAEMIKHLTVVSASLPYHQLISILVCDNLLLVLRLQKNMQHLESVRMIKKFVFVLRGVFS